MKTELLRSGEVIGEQKSIRPLLERLWFNLERVLAVGAVATIATGYFFLYPVAYGAAPETGFTLVAIGAGLGGLYAATRGIRWGATKLVNKYRELTEGHKIPDSIQPVPQLQ